MTAELQVVKEEKQNLLARVSQEQANVIALNDKLSATEKLRQEAEKKNEELSKEFVTLQKKHSEEANHLRANVAEKEMLVKDIRVESTRLRESEVEKALNQERERANARLDGILKELTKSNQNSSTLTADLENKRLELAKEQEENVKMKNDLELRTKEMNVIREEKIRLAEELEKTHNSVSNLRRQVEEFTNSLELKSKGLVEAENCVEKLQTQLNERERTIASFQAQGTNLAEILERNSQTGDSLQREREQLIRTLEERIGEVEEMKGHREILAKKLRAKDKRVKELEEEKNSVSNSLQIKQEELDAMMEDRRNIMAELKLRQIEVTKLKDENSSLSSLVEGKHGEREKEITKLISRLKGIMNNYNTISNVLAVASIMDWYMPAAKDKIHHVASTVRRGYFKKAFSLCLRKTRAENSRDYHHPMMSSFSKSPVFEMFSILTKTQSRRFQIPLV